MISNKPLVSVLMNCYNSERFLEETLTSLFNQTYNNWQLIFVDNHSTDNSKALVDKFQPDTRITYLKTPCHMPLGEAREIGIQNCSGEFICFLDTDDVWLPNKLEKQLDMFLRYSDSLLCYSSYFYMNEDSKIIGHKQLKSRWGDLFGINLAQYEINFQTVMIKKKALNQISRPYFNSLLKFSPDYNLIMRILTIGQAVCLSDKLVIYRKSPGSLTSRSIDLWGLESEYTYQQLESTGILSSKSNPRQRQLAMAKIAYYKAADMISKNDCGMATRLLKKYRYTSLKYFVLYWAARSPLLWQRLHQIKT